MNVLNLLLTIVAFNFTWLVVNNHCESIFEPIRHNRSIFLPPDYYPDYYPDYFRSSAHEYDPIHSSPYYGNLGYYGMIHEELDRRTLFGGSFSRPGALKKYVDQLIVKKLLQIPGFKESTNLLKSCQASSDEYGTCLGRLACLKSGGRAGSVCGLGTFCCTGMTVAQCGGQITVNNTYWIAPRSLNGVTDCSATVKLDGNFFRQGSGICQVRLDLINFELPAPTSETRCSSINQFQVSNTATSVPDICGSNSRQHMYLHVSSSTEVKLNFKLDGSGNQPGWKIRVILLPCGSSYLAPSDCLQYFTESSGSVTSFYSQRVSLYRAASQKMIVLLDEEETMVIPPLVEEEAIGERLRREFERSFELSTDPPSTDAPEPTSSTPSTTTTTSTTPSTVPPSTSTTPASTTTSPPINGGGYVYRKIKLGDQSVKICYKKT